MYYVVIFDKNSELVGLNEFEQTLIVLVDVLLLLTAFNMFVLSHCRTQTKEILCCKEEVSRRRTYVRLMNNEAILNR